MSNRPSLDDYVDVAERIQQFKEKHPEGSLQTRSWYVKEVRDQVFVVYEALAYRSPDDKIPGMGVAWEPFPGKTPYTRDSELMNAETAAWGRAIVACGLPSKKIASRQEVQARQPQAQQVPSNKVSMESLREIRGAMDKLRPEEIKLAFAAAGLAGVKALSEVPQEKAAELVRQLSDVRSGA